MPFTETGKNTVLAASGITHVSAHTTIPSQVAPNEVTGGSYARKSITFEVVSGTLVASNYPLLDIPAGVTVTHLGFWNSVSGGTLLAYDPITPETFSNIGRLLVDSATITLT